MWRWPIFLPRCQHFAVNLHANNAFSMDTNCHSLLYPNPTPILIITYLISQIPIIPTVASPTLLHLVAFGSIRISLRAQHCTATLYSKQRRYNPHRAKWFVCKNCFTAALLGILYMRLYSLAFLFKHIYV